MRTHDPGFAPNHAEASAALAALRNQQAHAHVSQMYQNHQAPQLVSEHGGGMMRTSFFPHQQPPSPDHFATQRLQQLQQMLGPQAYQALMQQQGQAGPDDRMGTAALWRQVSPIMGAMIQAQHGMQPQQNLSGFSPQVQSLVQAVLARQQQANQGGDTGGPVHPGPQY